MQKKYAYRRGGRERGYRKQPGTGHPFSYVTWYQAVECRYCCQVIACLCDTIARVIYKKHNDYIHQGLPYNLVVVVSGTNATIDTI